MSHLAKKHGSCNAIFSSFPINFNKENNPPANVLQGCRSYPDLTKYNLIMEKTSKLKEKSSSTETINKKKYVTNSEILKPISTSELHESQAIQNSTSDEKLQIPSRTKHLSQLSSDRTPVSNLCTPKNSVITRTESTPFRTPIKRYFSDHIILQSTPDCFGTVQFDTPREKYKETDLTMDEPTIYDGESSNLTVGVRIRPMNFRELNDPKILSVVKVKGSNIVVNCESTQHTFQYDHCFISYTDTSRPNNASQKIVFDSMVSPLVHNAFEGYNVCLFAYGQTGSGKSYSMMGSEFTSSLSCPCEDAGIIPRFCHKIFTQTASTHHFTTVEISYFEIYNEKIHDLLVNNSVLNGSKRAPLKVREHPVLGPYVVDLSQHVVQTYEDLLMWLKVGNSQRATAATGMNEKSSRSHSIFSIILTQGHKDELSEGKSKLLDTSRRSKINLVDLAGSERLSQTCASGDRLREGVSINKSLLILGKVIASLAESSNTRKRGFVPYRESVLTWLLKESLGGNSKTAMLATVSSSSIHLEETLATLRYACQARSIVNRVRINEDPHDKLIRQLKTEILRLRGAREGYERQLGPRRLLDGPESSSSESREIQKKQREIDKLKDRLRKTEEQLSLDQKSRAEKLQVAEERKNSELNFLRRCGIAIEIDFSKKHSKPCLVNLTADPMLSGTLLYLIPPGIVRIGNRTRSSESLDILLDGPLVAPLHCTIQNDGGLLSLMPDGNGETYVNGELIRGKVFLRHGDRLIIGGNHYFKICNPCDERANDKVTSQPIDYEYAHREILAIQEEKLRIELEESKRNAIKELEIAKRHVELELGNQKTTYESEIKLLGLTLKQQKLALEEINKRKRELEVEREMLKYKIEENKRRDTTATISSVNISSYETNFIQELEKILNETTADAETALSIALSKEAIMVGGITLHEMQLLVREATERCRDIGLNYEFLQQRVIVDKELEPVIRVRDKDRMLETFWQPMYFLDWVHRLQDYDNEDTIEELIDTDINWDIFEDSEMPEDSLDTSRISINLMPVKKQLNESLHHLSMNNSLLDVTADQTTDSMIQERHEDMNACLTQMEVAAKTLGKLCHQYESREMSGKVTKSLDEVRKIIASLRQKLHSIHKSNNSISTNIESCLNTVIENPINMNINNINVADTNSKKDMQAIVDLPNKSLPHNKCSDQDIPQRSVRFQV